MGQVSVVVGPPCGGKSTYVNGVRGADDVRIDYDLIASALGSGTAHDASGSIRQVAFVARAAAIGSVLNGIDAAAWIIHTAPNDEALERYRDAGVRFVLVDPGKEVCLERAKDRPEGTDEAIERWYESPPKIDYDETVKAVSEKSVEQPRAKHRAVALTRAAR